jgi:hypothetical protein
VNQQARLTTPEHVVAAAPLLRQTVSKLALTAWRSSRLFALILLTLAAVMGAFYRFHELARWDMNGDEGIAWVAAAKPGLYQVVATFWRFEYGGKLPLFDILLHGWVRIFGDSLFAPVAAGVALLAPLLPAVLASSRAAVQHGVVNWIQLQPASWPFTVLRDVVGKPALFDLLVALMLYTVTRQWRSAGFAWGLLATWMLGPVLAVYLVTYLIEPMEFSALRADRFYRHVRFRRLRCRLRTQHRGADPYRRADNSFLRANDKRLAKGFA